MTLIVFVIWGIFYFVFASAKRLEFTWTFEISANKIYLKNIYIHQIIEKKDFGLFKNNLKSFEKE